MSSEKQSLKDLKIPSEPVGAIGTIGDVFLRRASVQVFSDVSQADEGGKLDAESLVTGLIFGLAQKADDTKLSDDEVHGLAPEDRQRLVRQIIHLHPEWFSLDRDDGDTALVDAGIERAEGESDEEYLARGFRSKASRFAARLKNLFSGTSERMKSILGAGLAANMGASRRVSQLVKSMSGPSSLSQATIRHEPFEFELPEIPPNPIFDTNEILAEVAGQIEQMRDLAAATAEMQRTLNETASAAVADFSTGAEASRKATRNGLGIAGASLLVSVIALGVTVYVSISQGAETSAREKAAQEQVTRLIASEKAVAETLSNLKDELAKARQAPPAKKPVDKESKH